VQVQVQVPQEQPQPKVRKHGPNMLLIGQHTATTLMIHNVSFLASPVPGHPRATAKGAIGAMGVMGVMG
jgi:hypothetical protein